MKLITCFRCGVKATRNNAFMLPNTHYHRERFFCRQCFEDIANIQPTTCAAHICLFILGLMGAIAAIIALTTTK